MTHVNHHVRVCQKALTEYVLHVDILFVVIKAVNKSSDSNWRRSEREDGCPVARRVYLRVWEHACVILDSSLRSSPQLPWLSAQTDEGEK